MTEKRRFQIEELEGFAKVRVFLVRRRGQEKYQGVNVWWADGQARCVKCSGPLTAMLTSCSHAKAIKRFMDSFEVTP